MLELEKLQQLRQSLYFLHVLELRGVAANLMINVSGVKSVLIETIYTFLATGEKAEPKKIPKRSCVSANFTKNQIAISKDMLILKGAYKNDNKTRLFFKSLIGSHFHFTAAGIDWINSRWFDGNPPTYQEFADYWQKAYELCKLKKPEPKKEWALLTFVKQFMKQHPKANKIAIFKAWHEERLKHVELVYKLLQQR